ncbi:hypothetical protein HPB47_007776 [Ixodes persulcatus]|uniref:Uncharacterized protein n=1 Tax=Ixodes persulcatus TaxID=34615 RepID=A0AC60P6V5_IXOPE|nr:hypothetical protein HPB47_007776 [Ixodes persulcatus]
MVLVQRRCCCRRGSGAIQKGDSCRGRNGLLIRRGVLLRGRGCCADSEGGLLRGQEQGAEAEEVPLRGWEKQGMELPLTQDQGTGLMLEHRKKVETY